MVVKVSVVIPVYNPGRYIDDCIASLLRQSLPTTEFEAIFVDDGSTDGTGKRLERLAGDHTNVRAIRIPNSGWPGRPRNIGLEAATGRYVYFVDNDDWLGPEALERLWDMAERTDADVVVGKEVGHGKGVPRHLFRRNVDDATFHNSPLLDLLTPHKLFRRWFLETHGIRFPEGRRRLEDHVFVMKTYFAARRISILADYPCYHWVKRDDAGNATDRYADPRGYYENVREVLDIVDAYTEPGPLRDRMYAHWYRSKGLERLRGARWAHGPDAPALEVFKEVRRLAHERIAPDVVGRLPMKFRVRSRAVLAGRPDLVTAQAQLEHGLSAEVTVRSYERSAAQLAVCLSATLRDATGAPMHFRRDGDRLLWDPPGPLAADPAITDDDLDVTNDIPRAGLALVLRQRESGVEHDVPARVERVLSDDPSAPTLELGARAEVDLGRIAAGSPLEAGVWDLFAAVHACGWSALQRIPDVSEPAVTGAAVHLYATQFGNLSLKALDAASDAADAPRRRATTMTSDVDERSTGTRRSLLRLRSIVRTVATRTAGRLIDRAR